MSYGALAFWKKKHTQIFVELSCCTYAIVLLYVHLVCICVISWYACMLIVTKHSTSLQNWGDVPLCYCTYTQIHFGHLVCFLMTHMWSGLQKQGTWGHKIWLLFQNFMTLNFSFWSPSYGMKLSILLSIQWALMLQASNILLQYWEMTYYAMGCSLCPHAGPVTYDATTHFTFDDLFTSPRHHFICYSMVLKFKMFIQEKTLFFV